MFWSKKKVAATAKVLMDEGYGLTMKDGSVALEHRKFIIEVYPPDEPPFRCETKVWVNWPDIPEVGVMMNVLYIPGKQKAEIVIAGDPRFDWNLKAAQKQAAAEAERNRLLSGQPGKPPQR